MYIKRIIEGTEIQVAIPLTTTSGKTRIKQRSGLNSYGIPFASRTKQVTNDCYIEWQIGYDVRIADADKLQLTTLGDTQFEGANGERKALYELSEYLYYLAQWDMIPLNDLRNLIVELNNLPQDSLFDHHPQLSIKRSHLIPIKLNGIEFHFTRVEYPLIIHNFGNYSIIAEIITKEKQRAVGVQPMLYLCFSVSELVTSSPLIGRTAALKEEGILIIDRNNADIFYQLIRLFGMLSENHRNDVISIINTIIG